MGSRRRRPRKFLPHVLAFILVAVGVWIAGGVGLAGATSPQGIAGASRGPGLDEVSHLRGWLTTPDQSQLAALEPPSAFSAFPQPGSIDLSIDPSIHFQTMVGFGAALTDSSALVLQSLPGPEEDAILRSLFRPHHGAGIDVVRIAMGASDFAPAPYTYDDLPPGQTDPSLEHFSIAPDEVAILPVLKRAIALDPRLVILATPWSAPAWMKTSESLDWGSLNPAYYSSYAQYFVRFIQAYAAQGVTISAVSAQNEPENSGETIRT